MPKGLSQNVRDHLDKCRSAAIAAVDVYNRPGPRFRTAHYVILIIIAWSALLHAEFYRRKIKPWYKKAGKTKRGDRYKRMNDGEPRYWDLTECLKQHFGDDNPPERKNLEFLIGLRNKIEHRHLPALDTPLYGECQAALLNLEELLSREYGDKYSLTEQLAVSLQFSSVITSEKKQAAKELASKAAKSVKAYVEKFRGNLPDTTLNSSKYSFSVFLVPKVGNRGALADAVIEFLRVDAAKPEEVTRLERLNVLIKEKHIPIANLDLYRPKDVVQRVNEKLQALPAHPAPISVNAHSLAWKHFRVRPVAGFERPKETLSQYCVYDDAHQDYLYTHAWIDKLVVEFADPQRRGIIVKAQAA